MMLPSRIEGSIFELVGALALLIFFSLRYARSQLAAADMPGLQRLRASGLLAGDALQDYVILTRLLATLAPAVSLQQEYWVAAYAGLVRVVRVLFLDRWAEGQMVLLAAHQAGRYQLAVTRINALRCN